MNSEMRKEGILTVYGIDSEDGEWFHKKLQDFKGPAGKSLFKEMIARYDLLKLFSTLQGQIDVLIDRIENLEKKPEKIQTMGGKEI